MDRPITYYGALARALDILNLGQKTMVALGELAQATVGTAPVVDGFTCVPTAPASLSVSLTAGQIYQVENIEASTVSLLGADTRSIVKQAIALDATSITLSPPPTAGYAQNVLLEVQYTDSDSDTIVLNYYNAASPSTPLQGPGGNGQAQATTRRGVVAIQAKYGIAATSGTQVTPSPDAGWIGLFVVTLAYGQTAITTGNIVQYANAPFIAAKLGQIPAYIQGDTPVVVVESGTVSNTFVAAATPPFASYAQGQRLRVKMGRVSTGASTINVSGLGALPLVWRGGSAMVGGEWAVNDYVDIVCRGTDWQLGSLNPVQVRQLIAQAPSARSFTAFSTGSSSWTVPAGVYYIRGRVWGAGGGAGGAQSGSAAAGAGAGGYCEGWAAVTPGQVLAISVGVGGTGGSAGANGGSGGSTSIGSLFSATGGAGSGGASASSGPSASYGAYGNGFGALNFGGVAGAFATTIGSNLIGGVGGGAPFSTGPSVGGSNSAGANGNFPGGGAAGASGAFAGGVGSAGLAIIEY